MSEAASWLSAVLMGVSCGVLIAGGDGGMTAATILLVAAFYCYLLVRAGRVWRSWKRGER